MIRTLIFAASLAALTACSDKGGDDTSGSGGYDDILALTGDSAAGADVFASSCAACHGDDGVSGASPARDGEVPEKSDEELLGIILEGYDDMPAQDLTDQEAADVLAYLRDTFGG